MGEDIFLMKEVRRVWLVERGNERLEDIAALGNARDQ